MDESTQAFEELWVMWPNKRDKANTKLAFDYIFKKHGLSRLDYIKAAELWKFKASPYQQEHQNLANWLRDEKFLVELQEIKASGTLEHALYHAGMFRDLATVVSGEWNRLRQPWWASIANITDRSYLIEAALRNEFFQGHWQKALHVASNVFKYAARDGIGNIKLLPTIEWFCDLENNTVAKIIEGYYGKPTISKPIVISTKPQFSEEDKIDIKQTIEETKLKLKGEFGWVVQSGFTFIKLVYNGATIEMHSLPPLKDDQNALRATLQNQADLFNAQGYKPTLAVKQEETAPPAKDLSWLL